MTISTFSDLVAATAIWLDGSDLAGQETSLIALTEAEINARLAAGIAEGRMILPMIARTSVTIDGEYAALPDEDGEMILPISLEITGLARPWRLRPVAPRNLLEMGFEAIDERASIAAAISGDPPRYYTVLNGEFRFFPAPQTSFTGEFTRFVEVPALTAEGGANWVLAKHPNAYLHGVLAQAELMGWNDARVQTFAALFTSACDGIVARYPAAVSQMSLRSPVRDLIGGGSGLSAAEFNA